MISRRLRLTASAIFASSVAIALIFALFGFKSQVLTSRGDFAVFYRSGRILIEGQSSQLYDRDTQNRFGRPADIPGGYFYHPAYEVLAFVPLALMPYKAAALTWVAMSVLMLLLSVRLLRPMVPLLDSQFNLTFLMAAFLPTAMLFYWGQDSALLLLLFVLALRCFEGGHEFKSGLIIGLTVFKFQYAVPFILVMALRRRWRVVAGFSASATAATLVSLAVVGIGGAIGYWRILQNHGHESGFWMANLRGLFEAVGLTSPLAVIIASLAVITVCGFLPVATARMEFAVAVTASVLCSYHGHPYDLVLMLIPLWVILEAQINRSRLVCLWPLILFTPLYAVAAFTKCWYVASIAFGCLLLNVPLRSRLFFRSAA